MAVEAGKRTHTITLIPGDGIGPEVSGAVVKILETAGAATGVSFDWHTYAAGADAFAQTGEYIPKALYESIEQNRVALKGPVTTPIGGGFASINVNAAQEVRSLLELPPDQEPAGPEDQLPRRRPHHRPREHGRSLRRTRSHGGSGRASRRA